MAITYLSWSGQLKTAEVFKPVHDEMAKALHFDAAESMLEPVITALADATTAKFIVCLFLSYLVGVVNRLLPRGALRHLWLGLTGMVACAFVFGPSWLLLLSSTVGVYAVLLLASLVGGLAARVLSSVAVVLAFDVMFSRHVVRAGASAVGLDDCAAQMVLFLKLAHIAFAVYDGAGCLETLKKDAGREPAKDEPRRVTLARKAATGRLTRALRWVPSLLSMLGYAFNPTTAMAGPAFDFSVYTLGQDGLIVDDGASRPMNKAEAAAAAAASSLPRTLAGLGSGVLSLVLFTVGSGYFPVESLFDRTLATTSLSRFTGGDEALTAHLVSLLMGDEGTNPVHRVLFIWLWITFIQMAVRLQYYGTWLTAEGASAAGGLGLDPAWVQRMASEGATAPASFSFSESLVAYEKANNIEPLAVETATTYKTAINRWNKHTQLWLAENVFKRVPPVISTHATFVVSALWHGVFPGYFLSLPVMAIAVPAMDGAFKTLEGSIAAVFGSDATKKEPAKDGALGPVGSYIRSFVQWVLVVGLLNYFMAPFMLLRWERGLDILSRTFFFGHVYIGVCIVVATLGMLTGAGRRKSKKVSGKDKKD